MAKLMLNPLFNNRLYLDVEYGNANSFYSGTKSKSLPYLKKNFFSNIHDCNYDYCWNGKLQNTDITLNESLLVGNVNIERTLSFTMNDISHLFDMVSRFVVKSKTNKPASIDKYSYIHESNNLYYQFPASNSVIIPIDDNSSIKFEPLNSVVPKGFQEVFYIRDEGTINGEFIWVVHHRLIVIPEQSNLILRCCNPKIEGILPLQNFLPRWFKKLFFRIREKRYPNFPIMTVGEVTLEKGDRASLSTKVSVV